MNLLTRLRICCRDFSMFSAFAIMVTLGCLFSPPSNFSFSIFFSSCHVRKFCGVRYRMYTYTSLVFGELGKKRKSFCSFKVLLIGFNHIFIFAMQFC